jgi:RAB protein geranylgeranyltransferase component A
LPVLQRLRRYLRSTGRYGSSPFLIGHYGCIGEIAQGFCRAAAVNGGVYILGRQIKSVTHAPKQESALDPHKNTPFKYNVEIDEVPDTLECNLLISSPSYIPEALKSDTLQLPPAQDEVRPDVGCIARCIAIIDQGLTFRSTQEPEAEIAVADVTDGDSQPAATKPLDTGILTFPPSSVPDGSSTDSATVLITGEGSLSTPQGKCEALVLAAETSLAHNHR